MIIVNDRTELNAALSNYDLTLMLMLGKEDTRAGVLHQALEDGSWEDWHHWFLITNADSLTDDERAEWLPDGVVLVYVVLGGDAPKGAAQHGSVGDLLLPGSNDGDGLAIGAAFSAGDAQ